MPLNNRTHGECAICHVTFSWRRRWHLFWCDAVSHNRLVDLLDMVVHRER